MEQEIHFCTTSDGVRIAYATLGNGPPLVINSGIYSNVEAEWQLPWRRSWYQRLARSCTVVRYDKRGTGVSQRGSFEYSEDVLVTDLEAVIDHLCLDGCALVGIMLGGCPAMLYAVRHPHRVSRLVLYGAAPCGTDISSREALAPVLSMARSNWSMAAVLISNLSTGAVPEEIVQANERYLQAAIDGETFAALIEFGFTMDLTPVLPQVTAPALVMHERGNRVIPIEYGRRLATLLPNSRFVPIEGDSSVPFYGDQADFVLDTIIGFLEEGEVYPDGLSGREVQVIRLVAAGKTNREIGVALTLSTNTVDRHVSHIFAKTGAGNRAQAATYAVRHGLDT